LAQLGHRFAGEDLDFQPDLKLALVRPEFPHLWPGITFDHRAKIKAGEETESVLYAKSAASASSPAKATLLKAFKESRLANAGAGKPAVVFDADLTAAEQVGHRRDRFLGVFGAGTHRQDEVAEGEFTGREDLAGLFHRGCAPLFSSSGATASLNFSHRANPRRRLTEFVTMEKTRDTSVAFLNKLRQREVWSRRAVNRITVK
jgi:hypothetical protein